MAYELFRRKWYDASYATMSETGNTALLIASEYLSNVNNGKGLMLGGVAGVTPTEVVIIGAGTVGEVLLEQL